MTDLHGIILAYHPAPDLRELASRRTSASLPFCGRYRLIDFPLSVMMNAGVRDVGVIMQRDYQSLMDHLGSGKEWDLSRKRGGLRLLPPFGNVGNPTGEYEGTVEALCAVEGYIRNIKQRYIILTRGNLLANIDLLAAMKVHIESGVSITAVCSESSPDRAHQRFVTGDDGCVKEILYRQNGNGKGYAGLEMYIIAKETLLDLMERGSSGMKYRFHRDGMAGYIASGGKIAVYVHPGYARHIFSVAGYYDASMDMLDAKNRMELFPPERPIRTKGRSDVSTYYGENAVSQNCLVADGCFVEGSIENCILFRGARIGKGAHIKNSVIMQDAVIGENAELKYVVSDKNTVLSPFITLTGSPRLPLVIPKQSKI